MICRLGQVKLGEVRSTHHTEALVKGSLTRRVLQRTVVADGDTVGAAKTRALGQVSLTV